MFPALAKSASLPGCGKNEMSGGLPPSTCVLMFASQSASPVYSTLRLTVSAHALSVSLIEAIDGSSRSGPVSVTVAPPKSCSPPPEASPSPVVPSVAVVSELLEPLSSSLPQAAATSDRVIGTAASLSQRLFIGSSPSDWWLPRCYGDVNAYRWDGSASRPEHENLTVVTDSTRGRWSRGARVRSVTSPVRDRPSLRSSRRSVTGRPRRPGRGRPV
jgi:hypothetical protein